LLADDLISYWSSYSQGVILILLGDGPGRLLELEKEVLEGTGHGEEKKCLLRKKMYVIDRTYLTINTGFFVC